MNDLQKLKRELELNLRELVGTFETATGLTVVEVTFTRNRTSGSYIAPAVATRIELPDDVLNWPTAATSCP